MKNLLLVLPLLISSSSYADEGELSVDLAAGALVTDPLEPFGNGRTGVLRLGYGLGHGLAVETDLGWATGKTRQRAYQYSMFTPRINFVGSLEELPFAPLFVIGLGATYKNASSFEGLPSGATPKDLDLLFNIGTGVKYEFTDGVSLRSDLRLLFNQGSETFVGYGDSFIDWEWTLGLHATFGGKDTDEDGITDGSDQCVTEAEDFDGFEDEDGCPDTDNDKDGLLDSADACPNEPEDIDNFEDNDGCPELDNDKDGIEDKDDACPIEAGPVNTKGCPDTDGDSIIDAEDACPNDAGKAATMGCPDFDDDGVVDAEDECLQDAGLASAFGCPDTDADGVPDIRDACADSGPSEQADRVYSDGCASTVYLTADAMIFPDTIAFINGGDRLAKLSLPAFKVAAKLFKQWPDLIIEIGVHAGPDQKNADTNTALKAASLKQAFIDAGVKPNRTIAKGYGQSVLINGAPIEHIDFRIVQGPAPAPEAAE